jgi:hypothetical protein
MPKRVWILGAGASKGMGYPLGCEVLQEIEALNIRACTNEEKYICVRGVCPKTHELCGTTLALGISMATTINQIYGHGRLNEIDFEDYCSRLRVMHEGYFSRSLNNGQEKAALGAISALLRLLYWHGMNLWDVTKKEIERGELPTEKADYLKFVKHLQPADDLIITFNQDLLIESFLRGNFKINHHINNFVDIPFSYNPDEIENPSALSILKLHGSINWLKLKKEEAEDGRHIELINWDAGSDPDLSKYAVYESYEMETRLIEGVGPIPRMCFMMLPDIFKGMSLDQSGGMDSVFQPGYNKALEYLVKHVGQIIVVGYAARPTDYLASMLLNLGLRGKTADQVLVIDPLEKVPEGISRNIEKFTYIRKGFHQWIAEGGLETLAQ